MESLIAPHLIDRDFDLARHPSWEGDKPGLALALQLVELFVRIHSCKNGEVLALDIPENMTQPEDINQLQITKIEVWPSSETQRMFY